VMGFRTEPPATIAVSYDEVGVIAEAIGARLPVTGPRPPAFAGLQPGEEAFAAPLMLNGEAVAVVYADRGGEADAPPLPTHALDAMARHAGRCLEAITAFRTARALAARNEAAAANSGSNANNGPKKADGSNRGDLNGEDDVAARRYARLLVSEIKLYYEPEVAAGRRERDLATRLGGEIARARRLYEERVPAEVRRRADHFHDELVRTLAEGDATLLQLT
jgi:hypothetical protein